MASSVGGSRADILNLAGELIADDPNNSNSGLRNTLLLNTFQEIYKFAPLAFELGSKRGFLVENNKDKRYFSLFGNILFVYDKFDAQTFSNILFIESSIIKKIQNTIIISPSTSAVASIGSSNNNGISSYSSTLGNVASSTSFGISIQSFSGKVLVLTASSQTDRDDWFNTFERNKFVTMSRLIEDMELSKITIDTRTDVHFKQLYSLESDLTAAKEELEKALEKVMALESNNNALADKIASLESEKSMLLRSKGITPKTAPQWAELASSSVNSDDSSDGVNQIPKMVKIWTGTWNLGNSDPFQGFEFAACQQALRAFVPSGYDIYVLGVQESLNDSAFDVVEAILNAEGCYRFQGDENRTNFSDKGRKSNTPMVDKLSWKAEGGATSSCIGMAIFCKRKIVKHCKLLNSGAINFKQSTNKGAVGIAMSIFGRSVVFVTSQLDSAKVEIRRQQYQQVTFELGGLLSEPGYHLNDIFHHIIWLGDMNFTLVDKSGNPLPVEMGVKMLEDNFNRTLFESHDQLNLERKVNQLSFYGYREPSPFPNFYPTYKKIKNREPVDYTKKNWVKDTYVTKYKESLMKSIEVIPRFSDRILYHSMVDLAEDLVPECISQEFEVVDFKADKPSPFKTVAAIDEVNVAIGGRPPSLPSAMLDNYQAVNDGRLFACCDHAPVYCSFFLRLLHDHEQIRREIGDHQGNIQSIFSALALENNSLMPPNSAGVTTSSTSSSTPTTPTPNDNKSQSPVSTVKVGELMYESLLPPGPRKVKISNIKLMWGGHEEMPVKVKILFPVSYEAIRGESFVDFASDEAYVNLDRPLSAVQVSPSKTTNRMSFSRMSMNGSGKDAANNNAVAENKKCIWLRSETNTNTGIQVEYDASNLGAKVKAIPIPATQVQWFGSEPLDKLHIAIHAAVPATTATGTSTDDTFLTGNESSGLFIGHCSFGLEQLCKTALVSSSDLCGSINIARLLLKDGGFPMTLVDPHSDERENVTLCCTVELIN